MRWLLLLAAVAVTALVIDRLMVAAEARGWVYWRRRGTSGSATSAAMAQLHLLTQPSYEHVIVAREREKIVKVVQADGAPDLREPDEPVG